MPSVIGKIKKMPHRQIHRGALLLEKLKPRTINGEKYYDTGYWGRSAHEKQRFLQESLQKTRLIKVNGTTVLFARGGRQRRKK